MHSDLKEFMRQAPFGPGVLAIAALALLATLSGCYRWQSVEVAAAPPGLVRLQRTSEERRDEATLLRREKDTLYLRSGIGSPPVRAVPVAEVRGVERRVFSVRRTTWLASGVAVGALAIVEGAIVFAHSRMHNVY
jgi:hypothetical protein